MKKHLNTLFFKTRDAYLAKICEAVAVRSLINLIIPFSRKR